MLYNVLRLFLNKAQIENGSKNIIESVEMILNKIFRILNIFTRN